MYVTGLSKLMGLRSITLTQQKLTRIIEEKIFQNNDTCINSKHMLMNKNQIHTTKGSLFFVFGIYNFYKNKTS